YYQVWLAWCLKSSAWRLGEEQPSNRGPSRVETQTKPITNLSLLLRPQTYLKRFFNLTEQSGPSARGGVSPMSRRLREMQRFFGLQVTGTLDTDTLEVMKKPRCGIPDINIGQFSTFGNNVKWQKNPLTYRIVNYTPDLSQAEVQDSIQRALQVWASVTPLRFTRTNSGPADIMVSFSRGGECSP
uniref:Uncharacterized protein n=1 Tax=Oryzias sinensis TaxID=183150 RepID=A0A8C7WW95_9TELE